MSDDLRRRVDELEATVRGLTQELVEANDRINHLETALDVESSPSPGSTEPSSESTSAEDETEEADLDDIIVA